MMNNKPKEKIDAVKMMRDIRDSLSEEYNKYPEKEEKDLIEIRKKYGFKRKTSVGK